MQDTVACETPMPNVSAVQAFDARCTPRLREVGSIAQISPVLDAFRDDPAPRPSTRAAAARGATRQNQSDAKVLVMLVTFAHTGVESPPVVHRNR
jgi:hypothetical protein